MNVHYLNILNVLGNLCKFTGVYSKRYYLTQLEEIILSLTTIYRSPSRC